VFVEGLDREHERSSGDVRQLPICLPASVLLVQSMLHLGAESAGDTNRKLILLTITDVRDVRIPVVDAAIGKQAGIVTRRIGRGTLDGDLHPVLRDGKVGLRLASDRREALRVQ
jgi:hypothetical protein